MDLDQRNSPFGFEGRPGIACPSRTKGKIGQESVVKRTNRYRRRRRGSLLIKLVLTSVSFFAVLLVGTWVRGDFWEDPLSQTPLVLKDGAIRFGGFRPDFNQLEDGQFVTRFKNGVTAAYTLDPEIQKRVKAYFEKYKVPYGSFVAMSPKTGRVLALVDYSAREPQAKDLAFRASYPAASIFKIITAAAAIEEKQVSPEVNIAYRGRVNRLRPAYWRDNPKKDKYRMSLADALAKSNNIVFAKVAYRWLDVPTLIEYGERFWFNRPIPFEIPAEVSPMRIEENESTLAKTAAGFGKVGLSPLHAALIGAAIANDGLMMTPCLVDDVRDPLGRSLYRCRSRALDHPISAETAEALREMMGKTVRKGTVRKVFRRRRREKPLRGISVGGKTGSLRGKNPRGRYSWFIGMAPLEDPEIVVAAMIVNDPVWRIIAPQVAKEGLTAYFETHLKNRNRARLKRRK